MNKYLCVDCKVSITYNSVKYGTSRCQSCSAKERYRLHPELNYMLGRKGNLHPSFKETTINVIKNWRIETQRIRKRSRFRAYF